MPCCKLEDLPSVEDRWPSAKDNFQSVHWGDLEVGYTRIHTPQDCTSLYRDGGLAGGVCPCPHYGYVVEGAIRCTFPGTDMPDEVANGGDVYYFPAGHVLVYEAQTRHIEFNPASALQRLMDGMQLAAEKQAARQVS